MKKISFDFDSTLDKPYIQNYARELIARGYDIWICTSRVHETNAPNPDWNIDLYLVADELGIRRNNIIFTGGEPKSNRMPQDILIHFDDCHIELKDFRKSPITGLSVFGNSSWINKAEKILKKYESIN